MTKHDFLTMMFKLFGISLIASVLFTTVPALMFSFDEPDAGIVLKVISSIVLFMFLTWLLIFRASSLVDWLRLSKGFAEDRIELGNLKPEEIVSIATFIVGGLLLIDNIPDVISQVYWNLREEISRMKFPAADKHLLINDSVRVLTGILLISNYDVVARFLVRKNPKQS